jgi:hypothetical protein
VETFNRSQFPNGGWQFFQPQTNWHNPMKMVGFDASVVAIIKHRQSNPAAIGQFGLATDATAVGNELEAYNRKRLGLPPVLSAENPLPKWAAPVGLISRSPGAVAAAVSNMVTGLGQWYSWTDQGAVVSVSQAESRASVCVKCPKNETGDWTRFFSGPGAELVRRQLEAKNGMKLETSHDASLHVCGACQCPLTLKVWSPIRLVKEKLKPEQREQMPEICWVKTESATPSA